MLPCRPVGTENEVDIKKSSYKKVSKFLKAMEKKGVIKIKESNQKFRCISTSQTTETEINEVETKTLTSVLDLCKFRLRSV
ncbi:12277_t:CDS:2 [Funneliformis mosseae]|uniref:12277_t:CDS:1 n=1 Tax=Funneliformis mosseae TaxID=27381 RepID=A0A9N9EM73_FUNMO|nr:12277_t:CDS:2 [Funneliformis mosseae]